MTSSTEQNSLYIHGVRVDKVNFSQALGKIEELIVAGGKHLVVTPYAESIAAASHDAEFRKIINDSALSVPDGGGLLAAAEFNSFKLSKRPVIRVLTALIYGLSVGLKLLFFRRTFKVLKEPVRGVELLESLCLMAKEKGFRVYLLGGGAGVAEKTANILRSMYPGLLIKSDSGPARLKSTPDYEMAKLIGSINEFRPTFVFVAFQPVVQEKWLSQNMSRINGQIFMAVGGAFDMISGYKKRAPKLLQQLGLEWLWRLLIEPSRIGRIFNAVIVFPWLIFSEKAFPDQEEDKERPRTSRD